MQHALRGLRVDLRELVLRFHIHDLSKRLSRWRLLPIRVDAYCQQQRDSDDTTSIHSHAPSLPCVPADQAACRAKFQVVERKEAASHELSE